MAKINIRAKVKIEKVRFFEMRNFFLDQLATQMNARWQKQQKAFRVYVRDLVKEIISSTEEAKELKDDGTLAYQLGLERGSGEALVNLIADTVARSILIRYRKIRRRGGNIAGGIRFGIIKADYQDVLALPGVQYVSTQSSALVPWLEWLLLKGDGIIIQNYGFIRTSWKGSRSGGGAMLPIDEGIKIAWRITPSSLSGTENDNWFIRAMEKDANRFFSQIGEYIKKIF